MVSLRIIFWRLNNYEESIENWYYGNDWIYAVCISKNIINAFPGYEWTKGDDGRMHNMFRGTDLGLGGYVYAEPGMYWNVALLDVASLHPHSAVAMNYFGEYTKNFNDLMDVRIYVKHKEYDKAKKLFGGKLAKYLDDPAQAKALAQALKIAINSVYGLTSATFDNPFRNPKNANNIVALRGALFMRTLQDEVQQRGFTVAHIKTDSIKIPGATPEIIDFCMKFAEKYGYQFEHEATYEKMCLVNNAVYIARYMDAADCKARYGYVPGDNEKEGGEWTATGTQFQVPYVFKTLFSHEDIVFNDLCETKSVSKGAIYLDKNEDLTEGEHNYIFVGRVGQFCPIKPGCGGALLVREAGAKDNGETKYDSVTGAKDYRWLESEMVYNLHLEDTIDRSYFDKMATKAMLIATVKARDLVVGGATLLGLGASLIEMGIGLRIVAGAIKPLSEVKWTSLVKAVVGMGALTAYLTAMGSMLVLAQGVADTMLTFQNGLAIAAMGGGMWVLVQGVCALAGLITENVDDGALNTTKLEYAGTAMKTLMILMTAMSVLSSKTKLSSGAAVLAMAGAMNAVAVAAAALCLIPWPQLGKAAAVLTGLSGAMLALGEFGSAGWSEGAGIFLMADALMAVAGACLMMGKVTLPDLGKAALALAGLTAAGWALSKFAGSVNFLNVSTGMLAMSASLLVLAPAIQLIGMAKPEAVSQSLWIFADTMMAMFAGGMLLTCIPELALGLSTLAGAFTKFGKGMLYLAGAGAIFGTLALFADPLCTAIINAAPDIEAALVAVVTLICGAINQSAEPIGEAFTTLCKVLIQTAIDLIGWAWSGEGGEGEGIKGALEELGKNIWDGIRDIFSPFSDNGNFQQRNIAFKFNPDFKPQRINVADVFTFSGAKDDAEKEGKEIGENVANGGAKGVEENKARATGAVQGMVDDTIDAAKKGYDINSPSKVFEEIGRYITEGLAIGIQNPGALGGALAGMRRAAGSSIMSQMTRVTRSGTATSR